MGGGWIRFRSTYKLTSWLATALWILADDGDYWVKEKDS